MASIDGSGGLTNAVRFRVNETHVTSSIIDGEAIIINLESGLYYSLDQTGAAAWQLLSSGHSIAESSATLAGMYGAEQPSVEADLLRLAADLISHSLIVGVDSAESSAKFVDLSPTNGAAYAAPILNVYDDMGDVLALDPPLPQVDLPKT